MANKKVTDTCKLLQLATQGAFKGEVTLFESNSVRAESETFSSNQGHIAKI